MSEGLTTEDLTRLRALEGVSLNGVEHVLESCELKALAPGEVLLAQGQENRVMYIILGGKLGVHLESPQSEALAFLGPGETVGELSVLDGSPASAFVVAAEASRLLSLDEECFWHLVNVSHDFSINLLMSLVRRLRANNSTVANNIRLQAEYKREALVDALTGLFNRRWLEDALPRLMKRYVKSSESMAVLMIDIDHFKKINDTYGHPAGDRVLAGVAEALRKSLRKTDLAARYGGEEFVIVLPHTDKQGAWLAGERLRTAIAELELTGASGEKLPRVTVSVGGTLMMGSTTPSELIESADSALYDAKRNGRNQMQLAENDE